MYLARLSEPLVELVETGAVSTGYAIIDRRYLIDLALSRKVEQSLFTYLKGMALVLTLFFALYPVILIVQLLTNTVTESIGQIAVLLILSVIAWVWIIRLYQAYRSVGLSMKASE